MDISDKARAKEQQSSYYNTKCAGAAHGSVAVIDCVRRNAARFGVGSSLLFADFLLWQTL